LRFLNKAEISVYKDYEMITLMKNEWKKSKIYVIFLGIPACGRQVYNQESEKWFSELSNF